MSRANGAPGSALPTALVDALIAKQGSGQSLARYVMAARGAYPADVLEALKRLGLDYLSNREPSLADVAEQLSIRSSRLPLPHPLDFEWRFSALGCRTIAESINARAEAGDLVGLFGTPWFAEFSVQEHLLRATPTLFELRPEACAALANHVRLAEGDVAASVAGLPAGSFELILADPPWYPAVVERFLRAASYLLREGGTLLLCLPGLGTRPSVPFERIALTAVAAECELALDELTASCLEYESPPFEISALYAAGLLSVGPFWRRGDVMTFRRTLGRMSPPASSDDASSATAAGWKEATLGRSRVRVDVRSVGSSIAMVDSLVAGEVLDSVSTRDPRRAEVNIWTTSNRVFRTAYPSQVLRALRGDAADEQDGAVDTFVASLARQEEDFLKALKLE